MHTTKQPVPGRDWAPFTAAQSVASGRDVAFREQAADLARSLPAALRAVPYRWTFGDGAWARGRAVIHLYAHPGLYRLGVSAFDSRGKRWLLFDAALVRVVAPGQILQANLEYEIFALVLLLDRATWPVSAAAILAVAVLLVWLGRRSVRR